MESEVLTVSISSETVEFKYQSGLSEIFTWGSPELIEKMKLIAKLSKESNTEIIGYKYIPTDESKVQS